MFFLEKQLVYSKKVFIFGMIFQRVLTHFGFLWKPKLKKKYY